MKVRLERPRTLDHPDFRKYRWWKWCKPFFINPRGILIHRVREVIEITWDGVLHHYSVHHWCGNQTNVRPDAADDAFFSRPPKKRLLCEQCEAKAVKRRQKTADQLAGRHVHTGKLRAFQTCCLDQLGAN